MGTLVRLLGAGDNVVDRYEGLGLMFPGGNALNVAVYAHRAGAMASYLGVIGDDEPGRHVLAALTAEGVDVERIRVASGRNATSDIRLHEGDRTFVSEFEGVSRFTLDEDDLAFAASFDVVHTGDCSFLESQVAALAKRTAVSFDLSTRRDPAYLAQILPHARLLFMSENVLDEGDIERLLVNMFDQGPRVVIATRGALGSIGFDGSSFHHEPGLIVEPVDTLGAGDAYIGQFLVDHFSGADLATAMGAATAMATAACRSFGAFGYPTRFTPAVQSADSVIRGAGE